MYEKFVEKVEKELAEKSYLITADEARTIAKTSRVLESRIFKIIKDISKESGVSFEYHFGPEDIDETAIANAMAALTENGFKVDMITDEVDEGEFEVTGWKISW